MFFMIFSYFWRELRRGLLELRRVLNLSSAGIHVSSAGFDLSSAGLLDDGKKFTEMTEIYQVVIYLWTTEIVTCI